MHQSRISKRKVRTSISQRIQFRSSVFYVAPLTDFFNLIQHLQVDHGTQISALNSHPNRNVASAGGSLCWPEHNCTSRIDSRSKYYNSSSGPRVWSNYYLFAGCGRFWSVVWTTVLGTILVIVEKEGSGQCS